MHPFGHRTLKLKCSNQICSGVPAVVQNCCIQPSFFPRHPPFLAYSDSHTKNAPSCSAVRCPVYLPDSTGVLDTFPEVFTDLLSFLIAS